MKVNENVKVGAASLFGIGAPASNVFIEHTEPILKLLLLAGQVGIAIITIFYIYRQFKNLKEKNK